MSKNTVTKEQVLENMQDVIVRTVQEFDKPVTYVTVRMKNGFTLRESTTCVDPANYDENIGKEICLQKIEDKIWFLLGYALQDKLANSEIEKNTDGQIVVDLFKCKAGDGIGVHVHKDGTDYHFVTNRYGEVSQPSIKKRETIQHSDIISHNVGGRASLKIGHTYILTIDGTSYVAKLHDVDLFWYTFLTVNSETGEAELGSIPIDEMIDMCDDGVIQAIILK